MRYNVKIIIAALVLVTIVAISVSVTVYAQPTPKQTIYVDTSAIDARPDLNASQKTALKGVILADIKANYEAVVGAGNVDVTDDPSKKAAANRTVNIRPGLDPDRVEPAWGRWPHGSNSVDVYLGEFMDDPGVANAFKTGGNWSADKLGSAIGHTAGHEVGHSYSIGHNNETGANRSKMTKGNNIQAADRANTHFDFDNHSADVLKKNWGKPPCATAADYDFKVLVARYWGEPDLPGKPNEVGALDASFIAGGPYAHQFEFGFLGKDTDGGIYDGNSAFDFIYKSSMFENETDAQMISFIQGAHDNSQFVIRGAPASSYAGQWFILNEQNLSLSDFITNPNGVNVARNVTMTWDIDGVPGVDVWVALNSQAYGAASNPYNGFTYELLNPPSAIGYSATVASGQNTYVQSSNGTFGTLLRGQTKTINNSVVLNNTGDTTARVEARFNGSIGGVYGLISGDNVLNAANFALGLPGALVPLDNGGYDVQVAVAPPGATALGARLSVPSNQPAGDYSGTVILTFSNNI